MNKFFGIGNLCKDIEIRKTASGKSVFQNSIAIKNDYKNKEGNYDSEFVNIVVWNQTADFLSKYATKGTKIGVEGRLTNRTYEKQDGTKGYITEVVCERVEMLSPIKKAETTEQEPVGQAVEEETTIYAKDIDLTDDLPF